MRPLAVLMSLAMLSIPMAGCLFGEDDTYTPRVVDITLQVTQGTSETIPLYTLNDGERMMEVVAMGFELPDQDGLQVPNPQIRLREGDTLRLTIQNQNPLPHTFHLHGGLVPWEMDGVPFLTQMPIHNGEEYTYVYEDLKAGTYWYHCHVDPAHHIDLGMYGAFIVEEREPKHSFDREYVLMLDEWDNCHVHGNADPLTGAENSGEFSGRADCMTRFLQDNLAQNTLANLARDPVCASDPPEPAYSELGCGEHMSTPPQQDPRVWWPETHPVYKPEYNTYLINGKAFPDTSPMPVREDERVKVRLINVGEEIHSMHIHGHNMLVTHRDGYELPAPFRVDTLGIMPAERYDVIIEADNPGLWAFHDHVGRQMMNDHQDPGGAMTCFAYDGFHGLDAFAMQRALECNEHALGIFADGGHDDHGRAEAQAILDAGRPYDLGTGSHRVLPGDHSGDGIADRIRG